MYTMFLSMCDSVTNKALYIAVAVLDNFQLWEHLLTIAVLAWLHTW